MALRVALRGGAAICAVGLGVLVGFGAGVVQIPAAGPTRGADRLAAPRHADLLD